MRKTLLIAAAALAASVISSQAQGAVYSQNIVGYVNIPLTNGVLAIIAPALDADGLGTNNTVSTVFTTPALNDQVFVFNGTGYDSLEYIAHAAGHPVVYTTNWFIGATASPNYTLNPGEGVFYLPAANQTVTEVGVALTGSQNNQFYPASGKLSLLASKSPISGGLTSVLGYQPNIGDVVNIFGGGSFTTYSYIAHASGHPVVYTTNWFNGATQAEPVVNVGQGFFFQSGGAGSWTENVNP